MDAVLEINRKADVRLYPFQRGTAASDKPAHGVG